jgi:Anti-sigma factor NepR
MFGMSRQCQLQVHLGTNLQAVYQDLVKAPVPDRVIKLLDELKRKENEK